MCIYKRTDETNIIYAWSYFDFVVLIKINTIFTLNQTIFENEGKLCNYCFGEWNWNFMKTFFILLTHYTKHSKFANRKKILTPPPLSRFISSSGFQQAVLPLSLSVRHHDSDHKHADRNTKFGIGEYDM